ncbi:hypothetical protein Pelo_12020 [Pelomyxa schiedti]|nr:hypothetical protein Pelo_12020 [Pelomyxa schiedti]
MRVTEEGAMTADVTSWQCFPIDGEPFFCRAIGTGSWNDLLHSNHVATLIIKMRCPTEATEAQAHFWQQQSLSTEYRKTHRSEELNKRHSFKAICKRLGRDPVTGKMARRNTQVFSQVPTEEEQEYYSSDQEEDYNLNQEDSIQLRPDPSLKWELSTIPIILEGDLIPPPKPPILSDAENLGLALDLSKIRDMEKDSEEEDNTSTEEALEHGKPPHDVVRFHSAWKMILMLLSPVGFERMRGVCRGLLELVKSLERIERQRYREKKYPPAMRATAMAINCSPFCLQTVQELEVYGGFIAKRLEIHCATGQKPTPATLWPAIISAVEGVMRANTRPDTQLIVHHCPQGMVGNIIHAVMSTREPSNISLLTITGDGEIAFPPGFRPLPPDSKRCLPRIEIKVDTDRSCCTKTDPATVNNNEPPRAQTTPTPTPTPAPAARISAPALAPAPAIIISNSTNGDTVTGKRLAPGTPPLVLLPPPTTSTNAAPVENNRRRRLGR